jgi:hypothetical protein
MSFFDDTIDKRVNARKLRRAILFNRSRIVLENVILRSCSNRSLFGNVFWFRPNFVLYVSRATVFSSSFTRLREKGEKTPVFQCESKIRKSANKSYTSSENASLFFFIVSTVIEIREITLVEWSFFYHSIINDEKTTFISNCCDGMVCKTLQMSWQRV